MTCIRKLLPVTIALLIIAFFLSPALAAKPVEVVGAPAMEPGYTHSGTVSGRVTTENISQAVAGAYVAIVNAANTSQAFYEGQADANGSFRFRTVNNTVAGSSPRLMYCAYALSGDGSEGISVPFGVGDNSDATANIVINTSERHSSGFPVQHVSVSDEVRLSAQPGTIYAGGNISVITAQLYLNGAPYRISGVTITFFTDNSTRGNLSANNKVVTDASGKATISLTSGNATGDVNVTGYTMTGISNNLTGTCAVHVIYLRYDKAVNRTDTLTSNATEEQAYATPVPATTAPTQQPESSPASAGSPAIYAAMAIVCSCVADLIITARKKI